MRMLFMKALMSMMMFVCNMISLHMMMMMRKNAVSKHDRIRDKHCEKSKKTQRHISQR